MTAPFVDQHDYVMIVASGPSAESFEPIDGFTVIAVNQAINLTREATDYWFTLDPSMTNRRTMMARQFPRCQYVAAVPNDYGTRKAKIPSHRVHRLDHVHHLERSTTSWGLSENPRVIHTGNSAYGALGLAYHMRPKMIVMIGVDATNQPKVDGLRCQGSLDHLPTLFASAMPQLRCRGIEVINASQHSRIACFKKMNLFDVGGCIEVTGQVG